MAVKPEVLRALAANGATIDMIIAAVEADQAADLAKQAARRAKDAERQRNKRARHAESRGHNVTPQDSADADTSLSVVSFSKTSEGETVEGGGSAREGDWPRDAFDQFYGRYPRKVAKQGAKRALDRVRRSGQVTFAALMLGLERYIRTKPPDIAWCYPAKWLNDGRWDDEPDNRPSKTNGNGSHGATERYAADLVRGLTGWHGELAGPADEEIPFGRFDIDAEPA